MTSRRPLLSIDPGFGGLAAEEGFKIWRQLINDNFSTISNKNEERKMGTKGIVFAAALSIVAAIAITQDTYAESACDGERQSIQLVVRVMSNKPVEILNNGVNANNLHVCIGDEVEWQLVGSAKKFYVDFVAGNPIDGDSRTDSNNNGKIIVVVGGAAEPGESYKYDIGIVDGGMMNPRMIIDG